MAKKKKPSSPKSLVEFLRGKGGVKDEAGDLASREPDKDLKPFQRKLIQPKKGMYLDVAREAAAEAGYIPRDTSLSDLLDAIDAELRGHKVYSREDIDEVVAAELAGERAREAPEVPPGAGAGRVSETLEFVPAFVIERTKHRNIALAKHRARSHFLMTGEDIEGVHLIFKWRNPENKNPLHANWKTTEDAGQSLHDFWVTLHRDRGALQRWMEVPYFEEIERERKQVKKTAMQHYHETVRSLRKPGWTYARARKEYRRRKKLRKH